jgi:nicotinamide/nicotinate riboside kinase
MYLDSPPRVQPDLDSNQDRNSVGLCPVNDQQISTEKSRVQKWLQPGSAGHGVLDRVMICFLDGFLLYAQQLEPVMKGLDLKLFLLASRAKAIERRASRDGYVTLEGFWQDPPGYVEKIVWPNYVEAHSWLFRGGDVEGELDGNVLAKAGIQGQTGQGLDIPMNVTLSWAVTQVMEGLERADTERSGKGRHE